MKQTKEKIQTCLKKYNIVAWVKKKRFSQSAKNEPLEQALCGRFIWALHVIKDNKQHEFY